jgi:hypothetical protein
LDDVRPVVTRRSFEEAENLGEKSAIVRLIQTGRSVIVQGSGRVHINVLIQDKKGRRRKGISGSCGQRDFGRTTQNEEDVHHRGRRDLDFGNVVTKKEQTMPSRARVPGD